MNDAGSLTPNDLRNQVFKHKMRGYDPLEVASVLEEVAARWEQLLSESLRLREKNTSLEEQLKKYTNLEQTLRDTLVVARKAAEDEAETARKEANLIIEQARLKADGIIQEADSRGEEYRRQVRDLQSARNRLKAEMEALLRSYAEQLKRFDAPAGVTPGEVASTEAKESPAAPAPDSPGTPVFSTRNVEQQGFPEQALPPKDDHDETQEDFDTALDKIFGGEPSEVESGRRDTGSEQQSAADRQKDDDRGKFE